MARPLFFRVRTMSEKRRYSRICPTGHLTTPTPRDAPHAPLNGDGCAKRNPAQGGAKFAVSSVKWLDVAALVIV